MGVCSGVEVDYAFAECDPVEKFYVLVNSYSHSGYIKIMGDFYSRLSRCSTAVGSSSRLFLGCPTKVKARNSFLFTEGSHKNFNSRLNHLLRVTFWALPFSSLFKYLYLLLCDNIPSSDSNIWSYGFIYSVVGFQSNVPVSN